MTSQVLASFVPGIMELIVVAVTFGLFYILPLAIIIYIIRLLIRNKKENQRLRFEVAKLADELEQMRKPKGKQNK